MTEPYQRIFVLAVSIFYALLIIVGLFYFPPLFAVYISNVADALLAYCLGMIILYVLTLVALFWEQ